MSVSPVPEVPPLPAGDLLGDPWGQPSGHFFGHFYLQNFRPLSFRLLVPKWSPRGPPKIKKSQKNNPRSPPWTSLSKGRRKRTDFRGPWIPPMSQNHRKSYICPWSPIWIQNDLQNGPSGVPGGYLFRQMHAKGPSKKTLKILM